MRIDLEELSTTRLALALPGSEGEEHTIVVRDAEGLGGVVATSPERIAISGTKARALSLEELDVRTPSVHVRTGTAAALKGVAVELGFERTPTGEQGDDAPMRATQGRIDIERLGQTRVSVSPGARRVAGTVGLSGFTLAFDQSAARVNIAEFLGQELQTAIAGFLMRVARAGVSCLTAHARREPGDGPGDGPGTRHVDLAVHSAEVARFTASGHDIEFTLGRLTVEQGASIAFVEPRSAGVRIPAINLDAIEFSVTDVAALKSLVPGAEDASGTGDTSGAGDASGRALFDLAQLDRLSGKLHVDVTVDVTLPVIGQRVATHEIRVPIADGVINYKQLEHGLSALEDAVLDLEHKGEYLVLERDIPVIRKRKDLVRWPLPTEDDRFLAEEECVRLRRLVAIEIPETDEDESKFTLSHVAVKNLALELTAVRGGDEPQAGQGAITDIECTSLKLTGELAFEPDADDPPEGELHLSLDDLSFAIAGFEVAGHRVDVARVIIARIPDLRVQFSGVEPRAFSGAVHGVRIEGVTVTTPGSDGQ